MPSGGSFRTSPSGVETPGGQSVCQSSVVWSKVVLRPLRANRVGSRRSNDLEVGFLFWRG